LSDITSKIYAKQDTQYNALSNYMSQMNSDVVSRLDIAASAASDAAALATTIASRITGVIGDASDIGSAVWANLIGTSLISDIGVIKGRVPGF